MMKARGECRVQRGHRERGSIMVIMLAVVMTIGSLAAAMLIRSVGGEQALSQGMIDSRLLVVADAGLGHNYLRMVDDPIYAVTDPSFVWDPASQEYESPRMTLETLGGTTSQSFVYRIQYLLGSTPVTFPGGVPPGDVEYDHIKVVCAAGVGRHRRTTAAWYHQRLGDSFAGAIVSDMLKTGIGTSAKSSAGKGNIAFDGGGLIGGGHYVYGDMKANGDIYFWPNATGTYVQLDETNVASYLKGQSGQLVQGLGGTADEIPKFTALGGPDQLFDFDRYAAAAALTGTTFNSLAAFTAAMNAKNALGEKLEGIIYLNIDPALEGAGPVIDASVGTLTIPGGINISGTLVFRFAVGTPPSYKVQLDVALNINAADLTGLNLADETTFSSGFPGILSANQPWLVDISPTYQNFSATEDLPAFMVDTSIVDIHGPCNISGIVYSPAFIEIENKFPNQLQYINGSVFGGSGVYIEGATTPTSQTAIRFDHSVMDTLETKDDRGVVLTRTGYAIVK